MINSFLILILVLAACALFEAFEFGAAKTLLYGVKTNKKAKVNMEINNNILLNMPIIYAIARGICKSTGISASKLV